MKEKASKYQTEKHFQHLLDDPAVLKDIMEMPSFGSEAAKSNINKKIGAEVFVYPKRRLITSTLLKYAAVIFAFLFAGLGYYYFLDEQIIINETGEAHALIMPDRSEVVLDANSALSYKRSFSFLNRSVELNGNAFFNVEKGDRDFIVKYKDQKIKVLGTRFYVEGNDLNQKIFLEEGRLLFTSKGGEEVVMEPGDVLEATKVDAIISKDSSFETNDLLSGEVLMDNWSLVQAVDYINGYYGEDVIRINDRQKASRCMIRTHFRPGSLDVFIEELQLLFKINIRNYKGRFTINEINCNS